MCNNGLLNGAPRNIRERIPFATFILGIVSIGMSAVFFVKCGTFNPEVQMYIDYGANLGKLTLEGQIWRLGTSAFLHFGLEHLACNMLCLFSIGCFLEKVIGHLRLVAVYLLTAVAGGVVSCLVHPDVVAAGASGAVYGLFGASVVYLIYIFWRHPWHAADAGGAVLKMLGCIAINICYSFLPGIDMAAHVGGLAGGLLIGCILILPVLSGIIPIALYAYLWGASLSWFVAEDSSRMAIPELTKFVGDMMQEKISTTLKDEGCNDAVASITNIVLARDEGDSYRGMAEIDVETDGKHETLHLVFDVNYDGETVSYEVRK